MISTYLCKIILLLALMGPFVYAVDEDELENSLKHGLENYLRTGKRTAELNRTIEHLQLPKLFRTEAKRLSSRVTCFVCNTALGVIIKARRLGVEVERIADVVEKLCIWLNIESEPVCRGSVAIHTDTLAYIIDNKEDLTSKRICSILFQEHGCVDPDRKDWTIDIPERASNSFNNKQKKSASKPLKVLHLTDIHYDPGYEVSSKGKCDEPLCCQEGSKPSNPGDAAGYWSDYRGCDTPWYMFTDSIQHIVAQHKDLDFIYFTGDIVNHKLWDTDVEENSKAIRDVLRYLKKSFGSATVYPTLGNHEPHPVNLFSTEGVEQSQISTQWVFDLSAEEWKVWLPEETRESILKGGYYTTLIKPGFRVIGLNSNVCFTFNWWLYFDDFDPYGQLQWLVQVLLEAEQNNEVVHILSHIPNGDNMCLLNWSRGYLRIIDRFAHIVAAQINGHSHDDKTIIFFNASHPPHAINVAFDGGSLTTYSHRNPNYKIFEIDPENAEVLDFESWTFNLTEANLNPNLSPNWYKLYSFKSAYGVSSLHPEELALLTVRMAKTPHLTNLYFRHKNREADTKLATGCNDECEIDNLCEMVTSQPENTLHCEILTEIYKSERKKGIK